MPAKYTSCCDLKQNIYLLNLDDHISVHVNLLLSRLQGSHWIGSDCVMCCPVSNSSGSGEDSMDGLTNRVPRCPLTPSLSPPKRTTSQSKTEPPLLRTNKRTIYTAGRPPWYNVTGTTFKEAFVIGETSRQLPVTVSDSSRTSFILEPDWYDIIVADGVKKAQIYNIGRYIKIIELSNKDFLRRKNILQVNSELLLIWMSAVHWNGNICFCSVCLLKPNLLILAHIANLAVINWY